MGSFSTSLSGVEAASQDLAVISNNLANLDTTGYKDQEANFQDFFYQMLGTDGAGDPTQIGAGSVIESVTSSLTQGTISSTGVSTDMAIQGDGFFVVQDGASTLYTRAGDFSQNNPGFLVTSDGGYVLGYPAVNGVISPSQTLAPLQIASGQICAPNATSNVELTMNLDASAATASTAGTEATGTLTVTANATAGQTVTIGGTTYTFETTLGSTPDEVQIDPTSAANTLTNLADAINGTGAAGTNYTTGTTANTSVTATAGTGTLTLTAAQAGTAGDSIATTATWGTFGGTTLSGGTAGSDSGTAATGTLTATANATAGQTVTIGGTTYTFETTLGSTPDEVQIDPTSAANTLTNLADAIDGTGTAGTNYTSGTTANSSVSATASGSTLTLTASQTGTSGNTTATTSTWGSFGAGTLTGGTAAASSGSADGTFAEPVVVYDSLGNSHTLTFTFTETASNTWSYNITIPAADVGQTGSPVSVKTGTLQFDASGNLTSPSANVTGINVTGLADGAKGLSLTWQLFSPTTNSPDITQVAGQSNVSSAMQDGYTSGALQFFTINADGTIQGVFSNGQTLTLGQVALATFQNTQGLQLQGSNMLLATPAAGIPSIGAPGSGGAGTIVGQSLEASNVDMTTELSNLIVAERDYQSNARAISTADQMLNYVLTMQP
ncbi:MAG: flagellar hook-basal body complex protein [Terriglobia bacterium]|jgi:flagellar hook protein FlgE